MILLNLKQKKKGIKIMKIIKRILSKNGNLLVKDWERNMH